MIRSNLVLVLQSMFFASVLAFNHTSTPTARSSSSSSSFGCPNDIYGPKVVYRDYCFQFVSSPQTWMMARRDCRWNSRFVQGWVVGVPDSAMQSWLEAQMASRGWTHVQGVWLGLNNRYVRDSFEWDQADRRVLPVRYTNWELNTSASGFGSRLCVRMTPLSGWKWRAVDCHSSDSTYYFICQYPTTIATSVTTTTRHTTVQGLRSNLSRRETSRSSAAAYGSSTSPRISRPASLQQTTEPLDSRLYSTSTAEASEIRLMTDNYRSSLEPDAPQFPLQSPIPTNEYRKAWPPTTPEMTLYAAVSQGHYHDVTEQTAQTVGAHTVHNADYAIESRIQETTLLTVATELQTAAEASEIRLMTDNYRSSLEPATPEMTLYAAVSQGYYHHVTEQTAQRVGAHTVHNADYAIESRNQETTLVTLASESVSTATAVIVEDAQLPVDHSNYVISSDRSTNTVPDHAYSDAHIAISSRIQGIPIATFKTEATAYVAPATTYSELDSSGSLGYVSSAEHSIETITIHTFPDSDTLLANSIQETTVAILDTEPTATDALISTVTEQPYSNADTTIFSRIQETTLLTFEAETLPRATLQTSLSTDEYLETFHHRAPTTTLSELESTGSLGHVSVAVHSTETIAVHKFSESVSSITDRIQETAPAILDVEPLATDALISTVAEQPYSNADTTIFSRIQEPTLLTFEAETLPRVSCASRTNHSQYVLRGAPTGYSVGDIFVDAYCTAEQPLITWRCTNTSLVMAQWVIIGNLSCPRNEEIQRLAQVNITYSSVSSILKEVVNATSSSTGVSQTFGLAVEDVTFGSHILNSAISLVVQEPQRAVLADVIAAVPAIVSKILEAPVESLAASNTSSSISRNVEALLHVAAAELQDNSTVTHVQPNLVVQMTSDPAIVGLEVTSQGALTADTVRPVRAGDNSSSREQAEALIFFAPEAKDIRKSFAVFNNSKLFQGKKMFPASEKIISAQLTETVSHPELVTILFRLPTVQNQTARYDEVECGFWNYTESDWSTFGCKKMPAVSNRIACFCNHTTNFAVLFRVQEASVGNVESVHSFVLSTITRVGLSVSIALLLVVIISFLLLRKLRRTSAQKVLFNVSLSICLLDLVFLIGIERTENVIVCVAFAALIHVLLLSSFTWMSVEATLQYLKLVKIFAAIPSGFFTKAAICAWGLPVLVVSSLLIADYQFYNKTSEGICWIQRTAMHYGVLLPLSLSIAYNAVMFSLIARSLFLSKSQSVRSTMSTTERLKLRARAGLAVFVLMGLTWTFGYFAINGAELLFHYLFCIFNSLQGALIALFHCILGKMLPRELRRFLRRTSSKEQWSGESRTGTFTSSLKSSVNRRNESTKL